MKSVVNIMRTYIRTEWEQQTENIFLSGAPSPSISVLPYMVPLLILCHMTVFCDTRSKVESCLRFFFAEILVNARQKLNVSTNI